MRLATGMDEDITLAMELDKWEVTLVSGDVLTVFAHAYSNENGFYIFSALTRWRPTLDMEVARVPTSIVETIIGG
jgi:hypothetical protein